MPELHSEQTEEKIRANFNICAGARIIIDAGLADLLTKAVTSDERIQLDVAGKQHIQFAITAPDNKKIQPTLTVIREGPSEIAVITLTLE